MSAQRVVVLGGGPAGDVAALRAAQMGAEVVMVEKENLGGTCLNWGCIPTKALLATADLLRKIRRADEFGIVVPEVSFDFPKMMERKTGIVDRLRGGVEAACKRHKVEVIKAAGRVVDGGVDADGRVVPYDILIVTTGTSVAGLPGLDMDHPALMTSDDILVLEEVPERLLIIGGGVIGCEFGSMFSTLGTEITIVEMMPRLLAGIDARTATQFQRTLEKEGVSFHLGTKVSNMEYGPASVTATLENGTLIEADKVLVSIGRKANTRDIGLEAAGVIVDERGFIQVDEYLQTANPKIYAAGDCIGGLQLAHLAEAEAHRAIENALNHGPRMAMDRTVVPSCIYTHPEIATVGLHADAAKEAGHEVKLGTARFGGSGKALGEGESDGFVQLVADKTTDELLGATIMGAHAVELIQEIGVAIADGLTMSELGSVIHAHPTVSEMVMHAAQQGEGVAAYLN
jgi:dihydrolipoamide dehydrogenase